MDNRLPQLAEQVHASTSIEQGVLTLMNGIADRINDSGGNGQTLLALVMELKESGPALAAAVEANTQHAAPVEEEVQTAPESPLQAPQTQPVTVASISGVASGSSSTEAVGETPEVSEGAPAEKVPE